MPEPRKMMSVRSLIDGEINQVLQQNGVGRIAFTLHDRVDIEPLSYVAEGEWIYGRTNSGSKLSLLEHHPWCAFEVDEVRGRFDWTSVVTKGMFYVLYPVGHSADAYARAVSLMQGLEPQLFTPTDPAPGRTTLFRIHISEATGKQASYETE